MFLTGLLTAAMSLGVYLYALKHENLERARTLAFAALVFAELLRAFGARSETRPLCRMNFLFNLNLPAVVALSFGVQFWSHHNAWLHPPGEAGWKTAGGLFFSKDCIGAVVFSDVQGDH